MWTLDNRELRKLETILCKNHSPSTPEIVGGRFDYTSGGSHERDKLTSSGQTSGGPGIVPLCDQSLYCAYLHMNSSESDDADSTTRAVPIGSEVPSAVGSDGSPGGAAESPGTTQAGSSMHHQDSVDSGLLSGSVTSLSWQRSNVVNARCLRHSLSWPEIRKRRPHERNTRGRTSIIGGFDLDSGGGSIGAAMLCPLGGSISVMETTDHEHLVNVDRTAADLSDIVPCQQQTHSSADDVDSDDDHQVAYVTPTLSDVFLTDDTFQGVTDSAASDTRDDVTLETTCALATASGSTCDDDTANLVHEHTSSSTRQSDTTSGSLYPSSPVSSTKHSLGNRRAHKDRPKRPAIRVTLSHDGCQSAKGRRSSETLSWELER